MNNSPIIFSKNKKIIIILTLLFLEILLFTTTYKVGYLSSYPHSYDQTIPITSAYATYYDIRDNGLISAIKNFQQTQPQFFKGPIVPLVSVIFMMFFGPDRLSILWTNLFFFSIGQFALLVYFLKRYNFSTGLLSCGLFLLSSSQYYMGGGIFDARLDYAGMITFGVAFLAIITLLEKPSNHRIVYVLITIAISVATRAITGAYFLLLIPILIIICLINIRYKYFKSFGKQQLKYLCFLFAIISVILLLGLLIFYKEFMGYYGKLLFTAEKSIRADESGANSFINLILYYPKNSIEHFKYLYLIFIISIGTSIFWFIRKKTNKSYPELLFDCETLFQFVIFIVVVLSVLIPLLLSSQNSLAIGILTIPIVFIVSTLILSQITIFPIKIKIIISLIFVILGGYNYFHEMIAPQFPRQYDIEESEIVNTLYGDLYEIIENRNTDIKIDWMINHPALIQPSFNTYLFENGGRLLIPSISSISSSIFPSSRDEILNNIGQSDIVITSYLFPPISGYEFPFTKSLRENEQIWKKELNQEFVLGKKYYFQNGRWVVGVYLRPCQISRYDTPNYLEQNHEGYYFWLGNESAEITIENNSKNIINGVFTAKGMAGPSVNNDDFRHIQYRLNNHNYFTTLSDSSGWDLSIPLVLNPGKNVLEIIDTDLPDIKLNSNGDIRQLNLLLQNMKVYCDFTSEN